MKKILFLINSLNRGGAERVFVRQMNALHAQGIDVYAGLLFPSADGGYREELQIPSMNILQFDARSDKLRQMHRFVRKHRIDIVYSTLELPNTIARLVKITNPHVRIVIREGSAVMNQKGQVTSKPLKSRILDILLNWGPSAIIAVTSQIANISKSYQPFYARKIKLIENGVPIVDDRDMIEARMLARAEQEEFRILAVGSMKYHERAYEYLIRALALLPSETLARTTLVFAGDGILRSFYEKETGRLGVAAQVQFLGMVDSESLNDAYRNSDVFVLCSTADGSSNALLEAMSFGLPFIATRVGNASDLVNARNGFQVPFKDEKAIAERLQWFFEHPRRRIAMGLAAYDDVREHHSLDRNIKELRDVLGA